MKQATLVIAMLVSVTASATPVAEQKKRTAVDDTLAKSAEDIKDCGKKFTVAFDWKAYDALDWKAIGREKADTYSTEESNLRHVGEGVNKVCADKDYKVALGKISTIVYRSTNDTTIRVKAVVSGSTLVLENYTFGSTRGASDYETAIKAGM